MMLFCMKGMFSGNKTESKGNSQVQASQKNELQSVQMQMADLMEQNHKLMEEVKALKESQSKGENVVELEKNQPKKEVL
jgi:hypothetical protein